MTKKSISRLLQASLMCCLAVLFTACDDIFASEDNPIPAYLSMSDKPVTIKVGDTYRRKAISVTTAVVEYTSSDTKVATVDGEGMVTAIAEGEATITATATGYSTGGKKIYQTASVSYKVIVKPNIAKITTEPKATTGDIVAGSTTALVTAGVADGGTVMYAVTTANTKPTTTDGFSSTLPTAESCADGGTSYVWYYAKASDAKYSDSEISATAIEVSVIGKKTPLTLAALSAGTILVSNPKDGMQYSLNGGAKTAVTTAAIDVSIGDKVAFYGNGTNITAYGASSETNCTKIGGTAQIKVYGNIMSLVDETGFATANTLSASYAFRSLFKDNDNLTDASNLLLPAETLTTHCYHSMFENCTTLNGAPQLPAETLPSGYCYCYIYMFKGCTSLTTAPELPAMTLEYGCYYEMFSGCTSLTTAPVLRAATLVDNCYYYMFNNCTHLSSITCLATSIKSNSNSNWLLDAGSEVTGTKIFYKAASMTGWSTNASGTNGWQVENYVAP